MSTILVVDIHVSPQAGGMCICLKQLEQMCLISMISLCRLLLTLSYVDVGVDVIASVCWRIYGNYWWMRGCRGLFIRVEV